MTKMYYAIDELILGDRVGQSGVTFYDEDGVFLADYPLDHPVAVALMAVLGTQSASA